jgi:hypothetical protein
MKKLTFFLAIALCITACNNEVINIDRENQVIELRMPDATVVSVYSTAAENENMIDKIWVLEFESSTGILKNSELIEGSRIINNGKTAQLLPQLKFKVTNSNRIVCIANSGVNTLPASVSYSSINTDFPLNNAYYSGGNYLPMYGEMNWSSSSSLTCEMTRAVAKIQVRMGTGDPDVTEGFTADNVSYKIYDAAAGGYIKASASVQGKPQSTAGQASANTYYLLQKNGATEAEINAYIHEYPTNTQISTGGAPIGDNTFHENRQHIILEKTAGGATSFYRLDFYDAVTKKYIETKRNHHYIFTIQKVRSEGYTTAAEAHHYPGSNIEYVLEIEDGSKFISSNGQYAIITSVDTAYIRSTGAVSDSIIATARYQIPAGITVSTTTNSIAVTSTNPGGTMTSTGIATLSATNGDIKVTVNAAFTEGVITLKLGNITHRLYVKRKQP